MHVNIALIVKFMPNYFFDPVELPRGPAPRRRRRRRRSCSEQGPTRGLGTIRFHDCVAAFEALATAERGACSASRSTALRTMLATATPNEAQQKDIDFLLAVGELFTLVVYAQLMLENAAA